MREDFDFFSIFKMKGKPLCLKVKGKISLREVADTEEKGKLFNFPLKIMKIINTHLSNMKEIK